jgi:hypothetical protein
MDHFFFNRFTSTLHDYQNNILLSVTNIRKNLMAKANVFNLKIVINTSIFVDLIFIIFTIRTNNCCCCCCYYYYDALCSHYDKQKFTFYVYWITGIFDIK